MTITVHPDFAVNQFEQVDATPNYRLGKRVVGGKILLVLQRAYMVSSIDSARLEWRDEPTVDLDDIASYEVRNG